MLIAFNKPYRVMSQFSGGDGKATLADYIDVPGVYPAGRLDFDSEGLLLLTDEGGVQHSIAHPSQKLAKRYWAQVEWIPDDAALARLRRGVDLGDFRTGPAKAYAIDEPAAIGPRDPPVRFRAEIPTRWIALEIAEGKNRQVRRMTAAVGHPTLRLVRVAIGAVDLMRLRLAPRAWTVISPDLLVSQGNAAASVAASAIVPIPIPAIPLRRTGRRR